ncbi:hypothetical protein BCR44DRAFT_1436328 [Catenaria anguillulae PL171]|uniref:Calpain catalytic domain-containing protein n=1 Tax=Catenaria anguillulae PL171 TaxID=765915 RepID=A0A1Y2HIX4_9FUNG|nr:hypothetical protein BCR44DRAFT_1436328 [Catenaria anguillulae PL171]
MPAPPCESDQFLPWDHVYPKTKDGSPMYNPAGKYAVKLWWCGAWRKILVDDKIPVDEKGEPLLPTSPVPGEIWPWVVGKAMLKVCALSYYDRPTGYEMTGACFFKILTGCESHQVSMLPAPQDTLQVAKDLALFNVSTALRQFLGIPIPPPIPPTLLASGVVNPPVSANQAPAVSTAAATQSTMLSATPQALPLLAPIPPAYTAPGIALALLDAIPGHPTLPALIIAQLIRLHPETRSVRLRLFPIYLPVPPAFGWESEITVAKEDLVASAAGVWCVHFPSQYRTARHFVYLMAPWCQCGGTVAGATGGPGGVGVGGAQGPGAGASGNAMAAAAGMAGAALGASLAFGAGGAGGSGVGGMVGAGSGLAGVGGVLGAAGAASGASVGALAGGLASELVPRLLPLIYNPNDRPVEVLVSFSCHSRLGINRKRHPSLLIQASEWTRPFGTAPSLMYGSSLDSATDMDANSSVPTTSSIHTRLATLGNAATVVTLAPHQAIRLIPDAPMHHTVSIYTRTDSDIVLEDEARYFAEKCNVHVGEVDETYLAHPSAHAWSVLFKFPLVLKSPTRLAIHLFVPELIADHTVLRVVDNDSMRALVVPLLSLPSQWLQPNAKGYTVMADCKAPFPRPAGRFRLRMYSTPQAVLPIERPIELGIKQWSNEYEDSYVSNRQHRLFRTIIRIPNVAESHVSLHLSFAIPNLYLTLELYENNEQIFKVRARDVVIVPNVILLKTDDFAQPTAGIEKEAKPETTAAAGATVGPSTGKAGAGKADKASEKEKAAAAAAAAAASKEAEKEKERDRLSPPNSALARSQPMRRYILQAFVEPTEEVLPLLVEPADATSGGRPRTASSVAATTTTTGAPKVSMTSVKVAPTKGGKSGSTAGAEAPKLAAVPDGPEKMTKDSSAKSPSSQNVQSTKSSSPAAATATDTATNAAAAATSTTTFNATVTRDLKWILRVTSSESQGLYVVKDSERDEKHRVIKEAWEQKAPGRAARAREAREQFLNTLKQAQSVAAAGAGSGTASSGTPPATAPPQAHAPPPYIFSSASSYMSKHSLSAHAWTTGLATFQGIPPGLPRPEDYTPCLVHYLLTPPPTVLSPSDLASRAAAHQSLYDTWSQYYTTLRARWHADKKLAEDSRKYLTDALDGMQAQVKGWRDVDQARRLDHRKKTIVELEEEAARILAARIAAEQAAAEAAAAAAAASGVGAGTVEEVGGGKDKGKAGKKK